MPRSKHVPSSILFYGAVSTVALLRKACKIPFGAFDERVVATLSFAVRPQSGAEMILNEGQMYRCQNPLCAAEIRVAKQSIDGPAAVTCCCGSRMKKLYTKPQLRIYSTDSSIKEMTISLIER